MITPEKIKPFLLHEEKLVRSAAFVYFVDSYSKDPDILPLSLQAFKTFGLQNSGIYLGRADCLKITNESVHLILDVIHLCDDELSLRNLNKILAKIPLTLLSEFAEEFEQQKSIEPALDRIKHRQEFAQLSGEELWQKLTDYSKINENQKLGEIDLDYVNDIIEFLADKNVPTTKEIKRQLYDDYIMETWLEIFLINLVGEKSIKELIPLLINLYDIDDDFLAGYIENALAKIANPRIVSILRDQYPKEDYDYRISAAQLLGRIKSEESEDAILSFLACEKDKYIRTYLCLNLCSHFCEKGFNIVEKQIEDGYDVMLTTLEEDLYVNAIVLGIDHPELENWKNADEKRKLERGQYWKNDSMPELSYDEMQNWNPMLPQTKSGLVSPPKKDHLSLDLRSSIKIGRNDPCPCGSGKKYKKCCANS